MSPQRIQRMKPYYADESVQRPKSARDFGYNGSAPAGAGNTTRRLTRTLDLTEEGLMPKPIRSALAESNAAKTEMDGLDMVCSLTGPELATARTPPASRS